MEHSRAGRVNPYLRQHQEVGKLPEKHERNGTTHQCDVNIYHTKDDAAARSPGPASLAMSLAALAEMLRDSIQLPPQPRSGLPMYNTNKRIK